MRTDNPFRKSFACAGVMFAVTIVAILAVDSVKVDGHRTGYVLASWLFPALAAGTWGFLSQKAWSWKRYGVTVLAFYAAFSVLRSVDSTRGASPAAINFSDQLPADWVEKKDAGPIVGSSPAAKVVFLQSTDQKRILIIQAIIIPKMEASRGFEVVADGWRRGALDSARDNFGGTVENESFAFSQPSGRQTAHLSFQVARPDVTLHVLGQSWMQGRTLVACQAIGQGVEVLDDPEIEGILSIVKVGK